jgi:hypothetical protein
MFLARTQLLRENPWDNELKLNEHTYFFFKLSERNPPVRIAACNNFKIEHIREQSDSYKRYLILSLLIALLTKHSYRNRRQFYRQMLRKVGAFRLLQSCDFLSQTRWAIQPNATLTLAPKPSG